jgi:hypothetical protein
MRVLIVITWDGFSRNYVQTGAFHRIQDDHECLFLFTDRCSVSNEMHDLPGFRGTITIDDRAEKKHYDLFNVLTWRFRHRSRTFRFRFSRLYRTYRLTTMRNVFRNARGLLRASRFVLLGNRFVGWFSIPLMIRRLPVNADLSRAVREIEPDLVLMPSAAYEPIGNDLVRLGREQGFRTMFLIDNWDNLSSKSIFWAAPDFLGVWGQQSREHAATIHDFPPTRVFLLGTPRFEGYYRAREMRTTGPYGFPYVLFCGAALAFDELTALHRLDDELARHTDVYGQLRIVYRPHPYRQARLSPDEFREDDFRRVVLDAQVADAYIRRDDAFQPSLDYYPSLLVGAQLVVCPLTTMLIESLICGTPVLAIAYDDHIHHTSPHNAYSQYLHFEGIDRIQGLWLVHDAGRLSQEFRRLAVSPPSLDPTAIDDSLNYFLYRDGRPYGDRLAEAVDTIARSR